MSLYRKIGNEIASWALILGFLGIGIWLVYEPAVAIKNWLTAPTDYEAECIAYTTEFIGLNACAVDQRCNLSAWQQFRKRQALRGSLMQCSRMEFEMGLEAARAMDGHIQGGAGDDSSRSAPQADSSQPTT